MNAKEANLYLRFGAKIRRLGWPDDAYIKSDPVSSYIGQKFSFEKLPLYLYGPPRWIKDNQLWDLLADGRHANDWEKVK